jgi:hypothetical protein
MTRLRLAEQPTPSADIPASEPSPTRELTAGVARRTWAEPHVRLWWVTALVVLGTGVYAGAMQMRDWYKQVRLIQHGTPVTAVVQSINGLNMRGNSQPGDSAVVLRFDWHGQSQEKAGHLADRPASQFINVDEKVNILVDPNDPAIWTSLHKPEAVSSELGIPIAVVLGSGIVAAVSWLLRRRILLTYRQGERAPARVIARFRSALAPRLWTVRCARIESLDRQVFTVYIPCQSPSEPGETVQVILPPSAAGGYRPLAAAWFENRATET